MKKRGEKNQCLESQADVRIYLKLPTTDLIHVPLSGNKGAWSFRVVWILNPNWNIISYMFNSWWCQETINIALRGKKGTYWPSISLAVYMLLLPSYAQVSCGQEMSHCAAWQALRAAPCWSFLLLFQDLLKHGKCVWVESNMYGAQKENFQPDIKR